MGAVESEPEYGRTNWRRFAVAVGVPVVVAGGLVLGLANGALAASLVVSGQNFKLSATELKGNGFTQYSNVLQQTDGPAVTAISGIHDADIYDLCQTVRAPSGIPGVGDVVLRIDAGGGGTPAHADGLLIGMSDLQGDATFDTIKIGEDASTLSADGADSHGIAGSFGQESKTVTIKNLKQTATYTSAGTFALNGMHLHLFVGGDAASHECFGD